MGTNQRSLDSTLRRIQQVASPTWSVCECGNALAPVRHAHVLLVHIIIEDSALGERKRQRLFRLQGKKTATDWAQATSTCPGSNPAHLLREDH